MAVTYLDRADWGAGPVLVGRSAPHSQFIGLVAHHTVFLLTDYDRDGFLHGDLDDVKRYMQVLKTLRPDLGPDIPYSFVVFEGARAGDCVVAEGRGFGRTGAHTSGFNSSRYGVALAGNSSTRPITEGVLAGYRWIGRRLANPAGAEPTIGHRDTKATECPGTSLYAALPQIQPPFDEEDDMPLDDTDRKFITDTVHDAAFANARRVVQVIAGGEGNTLLGGQDWQSKVVTLPKLLAAVGAINVGDVDEAALAAALAPLLVGQTRSLSDADLAAVAAAVNDEQHRRSAG